MRKILALILTVIFFAASGTIVHAAGQYGCPTQYGGECPSQEVLINKTVKDPKTGLFVDIIGNNDNKFSPDQSVFFKIEVTNTGNETLEKLTIQDIFPEFVSFIKGPGKFDNNTKILSFVVNNLKPNETREYILEGKIAPANRLPSDQGITCVVNQAQTKFNGKLSIDNTQLCIEKMVLSETKGGLKVFPQPQAVQTPATGSELIAILSLLPGAAFGFLLRRASK
jgi:uncharacterized repeat protein (TIGR01451 family)